MVTEMLTKKEGP